jgi:DNA polymerase III subunit gamma/tau
LAEEGRLPLEAAGSSSEGCRVWETQVLARKWRPRTFSELTGQEHVVRALSNALEQQRLHHAYLLTGTRGVGKTTLARILTKALNCERGVTANPCGTCSACVEIDGGRFVDLIELDAASNTQVDQMRELLENALYAPTSGRYKVYIIDEVHMLSRFAFNAMLKTLEEPPPHVKFVLATTDPQKIPVTVLSRCLQFNLKQIPPQLIAGRLAHVLGQERVPFEPSALTLLARAADGSMRDGLSLLDQAIAYGGGRVEEAAVRGMLGVIDRGYLLDLARALVERDGSRLIAIADQMESRSLSFDGALQDLATLFHRLALAQVVPDALTEEAAEREELLALAARFTPEEVQLNYQIALRGRDDLDYAPDEYAGFTMALLRMLAFEAGVPDPSPISRENSPAMAPPAPSGALGAAAPAAPAGQFDGDWLGLVARLPLAGMARMLAQYSELCRIEGDRIELTLPAAHKHLLEKAYQERLSGAVREQLGHPYRLAFSIGETRGNSAAEVEERERQSRQAKAVQAIEGDPFVRDLVENFDARLIQASIKPIQ